MGTKIESSVRQLLDSNCEQYDFLQDKIKLLKLKQAQTIEKLLGTLSDRELNQYRDNEDNLREAKKSLEATQTTIKTLCDREAKMTGKYKIWFKFWTSDVCKLNVEKI